jgi:hypothetical protein
VSIVVFWVVTPFSQKRFEGTYNFCLYVVSKQVTLIYAVIRWLIVYCNGILKTRNEETREVYREMSLFFCIRLAAVKQWGTGGPFPGAKARPGRNADHSPPYSFEVKDE